MLVIGGGADDRQSLLTLLAKLDIRAIDGVSALTDDRARRLADWADVVILWGSDALHHTVSELFAPGGRSRASVIVADELTMARFLDDAMTQLPFANRSGTR